ncbi:MAG: FkbM family methyltransferase [Gammaproteobacteria bacterium]
MFHYFKKKFSNLFEHVISEKQEKLFNRISEKQENLFNRIEDRLNYYFNWKTPIYFLNKNRILIHTVDKQRLYLDQDEPFITIHLIEHGEWESHVRWLLRNLLHDGSVFIDVGAHIGIHTLFAAALTGINGRVYAIEPNPVIYELLRSNLEINGFLDKVKIYKGAASDTNETVPFECFPEHPAMSSFRLSDKRVSRFNGSREKINVPTVILDDLLEQDINNISIVKIDVEGFENKVLRGCSNLIDKNKDVCFIVEHERSLAEEALGAKAVEETLNIFERSEFQAYHISSTHQLTKISFNELRAATVGVDFFFIRKCSKYYGNNIFK